MNDKPGYLTTEFWVTLLTGVLATVTLFRADVNADKFSALIPAVALLVSGVVSAAYARARATVKAARTLSTVNITNTA